jgi:cell wall assembly regulator SMI1
MVKRASRRAAASNDVWQEYTGWLAEKAPLAFANLAPPAKAKELAELEQRLGQRLPKAVRWLLAQNNGERRSSGAGVLPGLRFLSCKRILAEWKSWDSLRKGKGAQLETHDAHAGNLDPGVRPVYTHPGWIPLFQDGDRADYLGVDLAPAPKGKSGQVINFGRDEDQHFIAFADVEALLAFWLAEVRAGRCRQHSGDDDEAAGTLLHQRGNSIDLLRRPAQQRAKRLAPKKKPAAVVPKSRTPSRQALLPRLEPERDLGPRDRRLDRLDAAFLERLKADKKPRADRAEYWVEGVGLGEKSGRPFTRGNEELLYFATDFMGRVPGPELPLELRAPKVCEAILLDKPRSRTGLRSVTFTYERGKDRRWRGGYAVETRQQFADYMKGRAPYVRKIVEELRPLLAKGARRAALIFGNNPRKKRGPELRVIRPTDVYCTFHDVPDQLVARWNELIAYLEGQGIARLVEVEIEVEQARPTARVAEKVRIWYSR